jgi:hypothetical protein
MTSCGLWYAKRGIVAVVADDDGVAVLPTYTAAHTPDACWALLARIETQHGLDCWFVVTDEMLATHAALGQIAAKRGSRVLVVSRSIVDGLRILTGCARAPPKRLALLLARLPLCNPLANRLMPLRLQLKLL